MFVRMVGRYKILYNSGPEAHREGSRELQHPFRFAASLQGMEREDTGQMPGSKPVVEALANGGGGGGSVGSFGLGVGFALSPELAQKVRGGEG